jgi:N utilization substance protein A
MSSNVTQARTEFAAALNQVCNERGIDPEVVIETIKSAIIAAYKKDFPEEAVAIEADETILLEVEINPETGATEIFKTQDGKKTKVTPPGFGRIAAQTAKQVILQRVREAEKDAIIEEYTDKVGTMMTGMVLRFDGKNVIFDIGRGQGFMPPEDQMRGEFYKLNQRLALYIKDIRETMRGKTIIVSRAVPELVTELFAREVPEVNSGAVKVVAIAREAGIRTKMAVASTQTGVDPVGSCVGQKGVRVQEVINELNNEKIDIIQHSDDVTQFISAALAPAEKLDIKIDEKKKLAVVTVPEDQLSLAIGRGGQNVRLAAKLTGYKIDLQGPGGKGISVTGEEEYELDQLKLSKAAREALVIAGITNMHELERRQEYLDEIEGLTPAQIKKIMKALKAFKELTTPVQHEEKVSEPETPVKAKDQISEPAAVDVSAEKPAEKS